MITKTIRVSLLTSLLLLPAAGFAEIATTKGHIANNGSASAVAPSATGMGITDAFNTLSKGHYHFVTEIEQKGDGLYKVDALGPNGEIQEFTLDLKDPVKTMPALTADVPYLTAAEVADKLMHEGYENISKIKWETTYYRVTAMKNGKTVKLHVNASTGAEKESWF